MVKANTLLLSGLLTVTMLGTGCLGGSFDRRPGQDLAEEVVWKNVYGHESLDDIPAIEWFENEDNVLFTVGSKNYTGLTLPGWKIQVTISKHEHYYGGKLLDRGISFSTFAHELLHYHLYLSTGDVDVAHAHSEWDDLLFIALDQLWSAGL